MIWNVGSQGTNAATTTLRADLAEQSSWWPAENCHQLLERGNLRSP
jgi:hypothetical protein